MAGGVGGWRYAASLTRPRWRGGTLSRRVQSRYLLCQAIACCLSSSAPVSSTPEDLLAEAADAVDDGLTLARHWEAQGQPRLRTPAIGLFVFGCRLYAIHQPLFLNEFPRENLEPAGPAAALACQDDAQAAALDAIGWRLAQLQRDGFRALNRPQCAEIPRDLRDLRLTHERLTARTRDTPGQSTKRRDWGIRTKT